MKPLLNAIGLIGPSLPLSRPDSKRFRAVAVSSFDRTVGPGRAPGGGGSAQGEVEALVTILGTAEGGSVPPRARSRSTREGLLDSVVAG